MIVENLQIKKNLYKNLAKNIGQDTILSSNTSTIPRSELIADMSPDLSNKGIKRKVLEMFGKDVSDTQIVNTVGSFRYRTRTLKKEIITAAKQLCEFCAHTHRGKIFELFAASA